MTAPEKAGFKLTLATRKADAGYWLWDKTLGMNLSMRAATAEEAYLDALDYYQGRLAEVKDELRPLTASVMAFREATKEMGE